MQQELKIDGVRFLMLGVRDLVSSLEFYRDKLGLAVQFETPGFAFLDGGAVTLALSEPLAEAADSLTGATEIVLGVPGVRAAHDVLSSRGVEFVNEPRDVNGTDWAVNFKDPDGHLLSLYGPE